MTEEVGKVAVKVIVDFKRAYLRVPQKDAAGAAEHIDKPSVFGRKQCIEDMEDGAFIAHP